MQNFYRTSSKDIRVLRFVYKVKILKGAEEDILPDGTMDYPDYILKKLDIVIDSVHSRFKSSKKEMTERIITALSSKHLDILGHPTARLIRKREGYQADFDEIFETAEDKSKNTGKSTASPSV
ncbi:MAG: hypothetical protein ACLFMM_06760 [Methanohalobium sp.]|uniref:hypothetical protein n=1 Tax=Methanohalobium sp. TaxID=2837493 RepID=UPI003979AC33